MEYIEKEVGSLLAAGKMAEADVLKLEAKVRSMVVSTKKPESSAARPTAASATAAATSDGADAVRFASFFSYSTW